MIAPCSGLSSEWEKVAFHKISFLIKMQILETYVQPREESFSIPGITITNFHKITAGLRAVSHKLVYIDTDKRL